MTYIDGDGNEAPSFDVKCNWNDTWTASTIPGSCECEHSYHIFGNYSFNFREFLIAFRTFTGLG